MVETEEDMTRCIYIDSVDSGRSSDTGTHQSWTSSTSSNKSSNGKDSKNSESSNRSSNNNNNSVSSSSSPGDPHNKVQIVNHNFCDYLGSVKRNGPTGKTVPTGSSAQAADKNNTGSTAAAKATAAAQQPNYASIQSSSCQNKVRVYVPYSTLIGKKEALKMSD